MEKGKISSLQMAMLIYPTIVATGILTVPSLTASHAKQDLWLSPILASFIGFITVFTAVRLCAFYPGKTIIEINEQVLGRFFGKVLSFFILFFYLQITGVLVREYSEFIAHSFLPKTPIVFTMALMVLLCAFSLYGGVEVMGRTAQLFFPIFVIPLLILVFLLIPEYEIGNTLPVLERGVMPPIKGAVILGSWFSEFFLIMFLLPFVADSKKAMKYGMITVFAVMITLTVVNLLVYWVLGTTTASKEYPLMAAGRYISYANFFENLDAVIMAVWIIGAFVKLSVFYYGIVLGTAQWLNLSSNRLILWPIGILIIQFGFWSLPDTTSLNRFDTQIFPAYGLLIQTVISLFLLVIATIKKKKREVAKNT